ncbi:MAG: hypothetical protein WB760_14250 [Xanthobacteraceae bacterium]
MGAHPKFRDIVLLAPQHSWPEAPGMSESLSNPQGPAGAAGNSNARSSIAPAEVKPITPEERGAYMLSRYGKSGHERAIFIGKSQAQQDAEIRKARETTPSAEFAPIPRATEPPPASHRGYRA